MTSDRRYAIIKADAIVPNFGGSVHTRQFVPSITTNAISSAGTLVSLTASHLGSLIVSVDGTCAAKIDLPTAASVATYWGAVPGDHLSMTFINAGLTGGTYTFAATTVGLISTGAGSLQVASNGHCKTVDYVMGGSIAVPTCTISIQTNL